MSIETGTPIRMWGEYGNHRVYANLEFWGHSNVAKGWEIWLIPITALGDITQLVPEKGVRHPRCVQEVLQMLEAASLDDLEYLKVLVDSGEYMTLDRLFDDEAPVQKWEVMWWGTPDEEGWSDVIGIEKFESAAIPSEVVMEAWAIVWAMENQAE